MLASGHVGKGNTIEGTRDVAEGHEGTSWQVGKGRVRCTQGDTVTSGHGDKGRGKDTRTARSAAPT